MGKNHTELCPACMQDDHKCRCAKWCHECRCWTNHTTAEHRQAEAEMPQEY